MSLVCSIGRVFVDTTNAHPNILTLHAKGSETGLVVHLLLWFGYLRSYGETLDGILSNFEAICSNWETEWFRSLAQLLLDDWLTMLIDVALLWVVVVIMVVLSDEVELVLAFGLGRLKASESDMWFLNWWFCSVFMVVVLVLVVFVWWFVLDGDGGCSYLLIFNDWFRDNDANSLSNRPSDDTFDAVDFLGALRNCS